MTKSLHLFCALAAASLFAPSAPSQDLQLQDNEARWRFSLETVDLTAKRKGTLLGVHYEVFDLFDIPGVFGGLGGYGSVDGDLGGFFATGVDLGYRLPVSDRISLQSGLFAGASGGAGITGSSGLALRPFIAVERQFDSFGLRLEAANMRLPGGDFNETTLSIGMTIPAHFLSGRSASSWLAPIDMDALEFQRWEIQPSILTLKPSAGSKRTDGTSYNDDLLLAGLKVNATLNESNHIPIEIWSAAGGGIAGFSTALAGYGLHGPLFETILPGTVSWEIELMGGLAGGGGVDTDGGFAVKTSAGVRARFAQNWSGHFGITYFDLNGGNLSANGFQFGLAWDPRMLHIKRGYDRSQLATQSLPASEGLFDVWQLGAAWKTYRPRSSATNTHGGSFSPVQQIAGISARRHITENLSIIARANGAVQGNMGGYSEALAGFRANLGTVDFLAQAEIYAEYTIGAAGGGGVNVGSGAVHQVSGGLTWAPALGVEFGLGIGRINALSRGDFDASVLEAGISFDVARILSRR